MARFVFISPYDQYTLGVRYLSSVLKGKGHRARIIILKDVHHNRNPENLKVDSGYSGEAACCSDREYGMVRDLIRDFDADLVGISLASISFGLSAWLSNHLRRDFPNVAIIWGGVDPTLHPELGIEHCDFLAIGEAEESLLELVETIGSGKDPSGVGGFWVRNRGEIHRNPVRPLVQDLDRLPFPDYERGEKFLVQDNQVYPLSEPYYIIMTQRGCPYRCTFCANSPLHEIHRGQRYTRRRSVGNVLAELHWIRRLYPGLDFVQFYDDVFTINKKWLREFAPRYREEIGLPFWCYTYPGQCDEETAALLKEMGVAYMQVGIQSASERTLREVYHRSDPAKVGVTAGILNKYGIAVRYDLIAGNPLETNEDHLATLETLLDLPHPFRLNPTNPLCFFFNSPITRMAKEKGIPLRQLDGVNGYLPAVETHFPFWRTIFDLTQYPILDRDFIRRLARDEYLKAHPEILEKFHKALLQSYWHEPGQFLSSKEFANELKELLRDVTAERDQLRERLAKIEGKWSYKLYKKLKALLSRAK